MKKFQRLAAFVLIVALMCSVLPAREVEAAEVSTQQQAQTQATPKKGDYLSLEEAGKVLREYMVARRTDEMTIKFCLQNNLKMSNGQLGDVLLNEAIKHTGNGKEGDALRWCQNRFSYNVTDDFDGTTHYVTFIVQDFHYWSTTQQERELDNKVDEILKSLNLDGKTDYEKIQAIYEYVCANVVYADEVYENGTPDIWNVPDEHMGFYSAYGALVNGKATCQGYAIAMYRLLLEAGIDNRLVTGMCGNLPHGWNIVKIGDLYYHLDATWDAGDTPVLGETMYFLRSESFFMLDHVTDAYCATAEFRAQYPISGLDYGAVPTATASGQCGENATWNLSVDGTLTISGTGEVVSYMDSWEAYRGYIKNIVIENGITSIDANAFAYCMEAISVSIPDTVTTIGVRSFYACGKLKTVTIPNSVVSVGSECFAYCWELASVKLSNKISEIGFKMFEFCLQLKTVMIPDGVKTIGVMAFSSCTGLTSVSIPNSVTTIGNGAFASAFNPEAKASLTIPASVTSVGETCFAWTGLREVIWNAKTTKLESQVFYNSPYIQKVVLSNDIKWIGEEVFMNCVNLKSVNLPSKLEKFQGEWQGAFEDCASLESITIPGTLKVIPQRTFQSCTSLKTIVIEEGVEVIGDFAFGHCGFESLVLPQSLLTIGEGAFWECMLKSLVIPKNVREIGSSAFWLCPQLARVEFMGDAPSCGDSMFGGAQGIIVYLYHPAGNATWNEEAKQGITNGSGFAKWAHRENEEHSYDMEWYYYYDEDTHYRVCTGCDYKQIVAHAYENSCDVYCEYCGQFREAAHNYQWQWVDDTHWKTCVVCGTTDSAGMHNWTGDVCSECGFVRETQSTEPTPTEPAPTEPAPTEPAPTEPAPTEPAPTEPAPTEPAPTEPAPTEPAPTEPAPTEPAPTEPAPTEPAPTEPAPTEPTPEDPAPKGWIVWVIAGVAAGAAVAVVLVIVMKKKKAQ